MLEHGKSVRTLSSEEEGVADKCGGTDYNPHSPCPCSAGGEEIEKLVVKWSLDKGKGLGESVLLLFPFILLSLIGNKLIFPKLSLFCP